MLSKESHWALFTTTLQPLFHLISKCNVQPLKIDTIENLMNDKLEEHRKLIAQLDRQKREREETPLRKRALELAQGPVDITRYRNERNLMLYPFCSTAKRKRVEMIRYQSADGRRWLEVTANHDYGMAKIWDFDILRFAISKAGEIGRREDCIFPPYIDFTAYECLKALGRSTNTSKNYLWIEEALRRLTSTTYCGNIFRESETHTDVFTLINVEYIKDKKKHVKKVRIHFNERLRESARLRGLLAIDRAVLHEEAGIKKRLLELVAVSKGRESAWTVGLERLQKMCAHEGTLRRFKFELQRYNLPWCLRFSKSMRNRENVTFFDLKSDLGKLPDAAP
ncbi:MAG: hypothetical protein GY757_61295 [bacterium]|nr:hypothetical protein [bacterium]